MPQTGQQRSEQPWPPAERPPAHATRIYCAGNDANASAFTAVLPRWAKYLQLGDVEISHVSANDASTCASLVRRIHGDNRSVGAYFAERGMILSPAGARQFDELDDLSRLIGSITTLVKRDGRLYGRSKDSVACESALNEFLPAGHWSSTGAEMMVLGAGPASIGLTAFLSRMSSNADRPSRVVIADREREHLEEIYRILKTQGSKIPTEYHCIANPEDGDALMCDLTPHSVVVSALGSGLAPNDHAISSDAAFPEDGFAWDLECIAASPFLKQAREQSVERRLHLEDGWTYRIHRWLHVVADVFGVRIPNGAIIQDLSEIARGVQ